MSSTASSAVALSTASERVGSERLPTFEGSRQFLDLSFLAQSWYCRWINAESEAAAAHRTALLDMAEKDPRWARRMMDIYAWDTFLAMNWPQGSGDGGPNQSLPDSNVYVPVWSSWARKDELPNKFSPDPNRNWRCEGNCLETDLPGETGTDATDPLIAQNGQYVYFESRANPVVAEQLKTYWESTLLPPITFRAGQCLRGGDQYDRAPAVELKLAWKVLDPKVDDSKRFFMVENVRLPSRDSEQVVNLGLVAMHVMPKVKTRDWIAMTFEHVDNAPDQSAVGGGRTWSFFNPACTHCVENVPSNGTPVQLTRTTPIDADTQALNQEVQSWLRTQKSVWQYYELVGTQNLTSSTPSPDELRNTVLEAYMVPPQKAASSCLGCHDKSKSRDFSFLADDVLGWSQLSK
ncbi:hypothetical protein [Archangium lipolyticum]|uniref:hypothetical protein n=1 Tax=Archangium lipolyticum TaxID=2970465 RepID=UPI002149E108|nr:hypothetical protein [Archangium lipolyticum]